MTAISGIAIIIFGGYVLSRGMQTEHYGRHGVARDGTAILINTITIVCWAFGLALIVTWI